MEGERPSRRDRSAPRGVTDGRAKRKPGLVSGGPGSEFCLAAERSEDSRTAPHVQENPGMLTLRDGSGGRASVNALAE